MINPAQEAMKDVAIILIGLNARDFVLACIESIYASPSAGVSFEVVYVDNASADGSAEAVHERFPEVQVIANDTNVGFCPAANQGARASNSRYFYFINDDTLVVDDAISRLVRYCDTEPNIGTVGSRLTFPDGREQYSGRRFPKLWAAFLGRRSRLTRWFPNSSPVRDYLCTEQLARGEPFEVDWVSAAGQIVQRDVFWSVGGFATDYYYWHEAVFCHRLQSKGYRIVLHPESRIIHYEGFGSGPRPPKVQRFHILNFHSGAFRCYCERHALRPWNPMYWLLRATLMGRAYLLCLETFIRPATRPHPAPAH